MHALTPAAPGVYLLGVTPYNRDPRSAAGAIFGGRRRARPTGPGAEPPLSGWDGRSALPGDYRIALTGTTGCAPPDETPPTIDLRVPADGARRPAGPTWPWTSTAPTRAARASPRARAAWPTAPRSTPPRSGTRAVTVTARDAAGNETVVTHTPWWTPPRRSITLLTPLDGAVYLLGEDVPADYECADEHGGSGLASCAGDVADGDADRHLLGGSEELQRRRRTDAAGGPRFRRRAPTAWSTTSAASSAGPQPARASNRARAGRVVLVRFSLDGFHGRDVLADGYPQVAEIECGSGERAGGGRAGAHPRPALRLRRGHRGHAYRLAWKTRRSWAGTCRQFLLGLADGTVHRADYRFKR